MFSLFDGDDSMMLSIVQPSKVRCLTWVPGGCLSYRKGCQCVTLVLLVRNYLIGDPTRRHRQQSSSVRLRVAHELPYLARNLCQRSYRAKPVTRSRKEETGQGLAQVWVPRGPDNSGTTLQQPSLLPYIYTY